MKKFRAEDRIRQTERLVERKTDDQTNSDRQAGRH